MNVSHLIDFVLQILGWLGPVTGLMFLGLRLGVPLGRGAGIRPIAFGTTTLVVAMLMRVFWMVTFEPASESFELLAHAMVALGLIAIVVGSRALVDHHLSWHAPALHSSQDRQKRRVAVTTSGFVLLLSTVDLFGPGPVHLVDSALYGLILALLVGMEWHLIREISPGPFTDLRWSARTALIAAAFVPVAGLAHISHIDEPSSATTSLALRLIDGGLLTFNAVCFMVYLRTVSGSRSMRESVTESDVPLALSRQLVLRRLAALLTMALVVVAVGGVVVSEIIRSNIQVVEKTILQEQRGVAKSVASNLTGLMSELVRAVGRLTDLRSVRRTDIKGMNEDFRMAYARWGNIATHFSRIDANGRLVYTYPEMSSVVGADLSEQPHVRRFLGRPDTLISDIFTAVQGHQAVAIYVPVVDEQGRFSGAIAMLIGMNAFSQRALRNVGYLNPNPVVAVNARGSIIAGTDSIHLGKQAAYFLTQILPDEVDQTEADQTMASVLAAEGSDAHVIVGEESLFSRRWVLTEPVTMGGGRWGIVMLVVQNADLVSLYQGTVRQQFVMWLAFTGTLLFMMGAIAFVFYRWSRFLETEVVHKLDLVRLTEGKYRELFEESRDAVYMSTDTGQLLDINPAGIRMFGFDSRDQMFAAGPVTQYYTDPAQREQLTRVLEARGYTNDTELHLRRRDGSPLIVVASITGSRDAEGRIVQYRGILRDITQQKHLEEEIRQAQKMESVGLLAGGVAHDFNNLLGGVLGYASFMKAKLPAGHDFIQYLETIERSAQRAAELTSKLLAFARGGQYDVRAVNMNAVVQETVGILARSIDKSITVETSLAENLPTVEGDGGQLQQVMMNLCLNARDAMPSGGSLRIGTELRLWGTEEVNRHAGAQPGRYVVITVQDTGTGMDPATRLRIFEPFFSTKGKGKGTGLGLSMVYGIVRNHRGAISVESEPGKGSQFTISLPASDLEEEQTLPSASASVGGHERVLIIDDEKDVCSMMGEVLSSAGYTVETASDGVEGVAAYRRKRPDLVILDMIMPKMSGAETYDALAHDDLDVKVLLVTGYSQDGKAQEILRRGAAGFLQKPFVAEELLKKVRGVLD